MNATRYNKRLPKRFSVSMSEEAYTRLRELAERLGLSNNYVLTTLLEYADELIDPEAFDRAVAAMLESARVER